MLFFYPLIDDFFALAGGQLGAVDDWDLGSE
jgi:hypothetical protein